MKGIDVSKHNGVVNFKQVKAAGYDFAIIRLGYGGDITSQDDYRFEVNYKNAREAGLLVGVYIYSYAKTPKMAENEADHCIRLLKGKTLDFPVYYDLEDRSIMHLDWNVQAKCFGDRMNEAGYQVGIYTFASAMHKLNDKTTSLYPIWIAKWGANNGRESIKNPGYSMWQYTSRGIVKGVVGEVDCNVFNGKIEHKGPEKREKKTIEQLAIETIDGKYGTGDTREVKLGANYKKVQTLINKCFKLAEETLAGKYGNDETRKKKLGKNYKLVQHMINKGVVK